MEINKLIEKTISLNLLFIEDDHALRVSTMSIFENFFQDIFVATNGLEGLEILNNSDVDLIITDLSMPKMSGLEMIDKIRINDKQIPIIVMSAYNELNIVEKVKQHGINGYVYKPLEFEQLCSQLESILINR